MWGPQGCRDALTIAESNFNVWSDIDNETLAVSAEAALVVGPRAPSSKAPSNLEVAPAPRSRALIEGHLFSCHHIFSPALPSAPYGPGVHEEDRGRILIGFVQTSECP